MVYVKPWSKESEQILRRLSKNGKAWTKNKRLPSEFGMKCKEINDFVDIAEIRQRKKERETIFVTKDNSIIVPQKGKFFFYKIF